MSHKTNECYAIGNVLASPLNGVKSANISVAAQNHRIPVVLVCDGMSGSDASWLPTLLNWLFEQQSALQGQNESANLHRFSVTVMTTGEHSPFLIPPRLLGSPLGGEGGEVFFFSRSWLQPQEWGELLHEVTLPGESNWEKTVPWLRQLLTRETESVMPSLYSPLDAETTVVVLSADAKTAQNRVAALLPKYISHFLWWQPGDNWDEFLNDISRSLVTASKELTVAERDPQKARVINNVFPDICLPTLQGKRLFLSATPIEEKELPPSLASVCAVRAQGKTMLMGEVTISSQIEVATLILKDQYKTLFSEISVLKTPESNHKGQCGLVLRLRPQDWQNIPCGALFRATLACSFGNRLVDIPLVLAVWRATTDAAGFLRVGNDSNASAANSAQTTTNGTTVETAIKQTASSPLPRVLGTLICLISLAAGGFFFWQWRETRKKLQSFSLIPEQVAKEDLTQMLKKFLDKYGLQLPQDTQKYADVVELALQESQAGIDRQRDFNQILADLDFADPNVSIAEVQKEIKKLKDGPNVQDLVKIKEDKRNQELEIRDLKIKLKEFDELKSKLAELYSKLKLSGSNASVNGIQNKITELGKEITKLEQQLSEAQRKGSSGPAQPSTERIAAEVDQQLAPLYAGLKLRGSNASVNGVQRKFEELENEITRLEQQLSETQRKAPPAQPSQEQIAAGVNQQLAPLYTALGLSGSNASIGGIQAKFGELKEQVTKLTQQIASLGNRAGDGDGELQTSVQTLLTLVARKQQPIQAADLAAVAHEFLHHSPASQSEKLAVLALKIFLTGQEPNYRSDFRKAFLNEIRKEKNSGLKAKMEKLAEEFPSP